MRPSQKATSKFCPHAALPKWSSKFHNSASLPTLIIKFIPNSVNDHFFISAAHSNSARSISLPLSVPNALPYPQPILTRHNRKISQPSMQCLSLLLPPVYSSPSVFRHQRIQTITHILKFKGFWLDVTQFSKFWNFTLPDHHKFCSSQHLKRKAHTLCPILLILASYENVN